MSIISYTFLLLFLPTIIFLYWRVFTGSRQKLYLFCLSSYFFYALSGIEFMLLLLALSLATFLLARWDKGIWFSVGLNLAALGLFKYWDFGATNINTLSVELGIPTVVPLLKLALPLGISFYVFKHIGYLLEVKHQHYLPTGDFLLFTTYSAFFPQISAGPISGFQQTGKELSNLPKSISSQQIYQGLIYISVGMAKKLLIADPINEALQGQLFAPNVQYSGLVWAWYSVIMFALGLYFDFSGYTDIVLGIGQLFGISLPSNFNSPYLSTNPSNFWQRWHISLSSWFRVYLFLPLSRILLKRYGAKHNEVVQYSANMITMGLIGFWHGANWTYILWGLYHGAVLNIYAGIRRRVPSPPRTPILSHIFFIVILLIGWVFFLSPNLTFVQNLLANMFALHGIGNWNDIHVFIFDAPILSTVFIAGFLAISGFSEAVNLPRSRHPIYMLAMGIIVVLCMLKMGAVRQFLYVQF
jgi:alginate O-acetyltransferase complex protein AlgI